MKKQVNKKYLFRIILAITVIFLVGLAIYMTFPNKNDKVIAKVNSRKIYKSELNDKLHDMFQNVDPEELDKETLPKEVLEILVKDIYAQKELDRKARQSGVMRDKEVRKEIENFTNKTVRKAYLDSVVKNKVTDIAVKDKYAELVTTLQGKKEFEIKHIMVKTKKEADDIVSRLKSSSSFESLAKQYSIDQSSAKKGGDLGYIVEDALPPEFHAALDKMTKGSFSAPVKTNYGWHVIKFQNSRDAKAAPFESVKDALAEQMKREEIRKIINGITDKMQVKILIDTKDKNSEEKDKSKAIPEGNKKIQENAVTNDHDKVSADKEKDDSDQDESSAEEPAQKDQ